MLSLPSVSFYFMAYCADTADLLTICSYIYASPLESMTGFTFQFPPTDLIKFLQRPLSSARQGWFGHPIDFPMIWAYGP